MTKPCYYWGKATAKELYNYPICDSCKSKLKMFTEATYDTSTKFKLHL
jgi:hypothetical protein